jgi:salicylate hydroxylase
MGRTGESLRVLLVGGGIGGLTAAIALARRGLAPVVLEQAEAFAEVGAGLQLAPNATARLFGLGLEREVRASGFAPQRVELRDSQGGAILLDTPLGAEAERRWGAPYLQVHRADLHAILREAAERAGVELHTNARVHALDQDAAGVRAELERGGTVEGAVLVGADGVHSGVRSLLFGPTPARFTGQVAWRGLVPVERLKPGLIPPLAQVWTGPGRHFLHYLVRGGTLVNFVGVVDGQAWSPETWSELGERDQLAADFPGWPEPVQALIGAVERCWRWAIHDRAPLDRWSVDRVSLLGDAAHPTPPFLAQGAGMAIEDACALARHLSSRNLYEISDASAALAAYETERRPRAARVRAWARRNGRLFHLPRGLRRGVFLGARLTAPTPAAAAARLDWLYGSRESPDAATQNGRTSSN